MNNNYIGNKIRYKDNDTIFGYLVLNCCLYRSRTNINGKLYLVVRINNYWEIYE